MYEEFYGFNEKPFHLTPDPNFFFASKLHARALSYLKYGITQGEGFIVITGAIGTGKTTIANNLMNSIDDDLVAIQIVTPKLNPDDLVFMTASKLGLQTENKSKASLLQAIEQRLSELHHQGKRALLLVDEAQNLPLESVEELRMLSNFQLEGKPLLQSFLLGQPELRNLLQLPAMEQFRQRVVASCNLQPLSLDETRAYIHFRIHAAAGDQDKAVFSSAAIDNIYSYSCGIPRRINTLCDRVLLYGFLEEKSFITEQETALVIAEIKEESTNISSTDEQIETSYDQSQDIKLTDLAAPNHQQEVSSDSQMLAKDLREIRNMVDDIKETLNTNIEYKLKVSRYIDNAINRKLKELKKLTPEQD
ncbi:XrtA/PEP-CTERM system-associated ATPase [Gayadomonas joobiniege]|uniref:XrtA/PEP-CTERM system-associated ATPase n=1 Tax=Gayadomonas joobiniege TaxID=1234606 RepID=UPI00037DF826|nr:XrtA/PEP-CTERM system-associated ATPase [Gayadomonas joobiniege]